MARIGPRRPIAPEYDLTLESILTLKCNLAYFATTQRRSDASMCNGVEMQAQAEAQV